MVISNHLLHDCELAVINNLTLNHAALEKHELALEREGAPNKTPQRPPI